MCAIARFIRRLVGIFRKHAPIKIHRIGVRAIAFAHLKFDRILARFERARLYGIDCSRPLVVISVRDIDRHVFDFAVLVHETRTLHFVCNDLALDIVENALNKTALRLIPELKLRELVAVEIRFCGKLIIEAAELFCGRLERLVRRQISFIFQAKRIKIAEISVTFCGKHETARPLIIRLQRYLEIFGLPR